MQEQEQARAADQSEPASDLVEVIDSAFPLVLIRVPAALHGPAIQSMFEGMDRVLARQSRFSLAVDTRAMKSFPTAVERNAIGQWMKDRTLAEARYNLGNAIILSSSLARATFTAIQWVRRPVTEHAYVADILEGLDWCVGRLQRAQIAIPPTVAALRAAEQSR